MFGGVCLLWVFLLAFHALRPRYGFPRLLFYSHAQFPLRDISISFRGGLSRLLFFSYTHAMGFPAYFSTPTPSFLSATYRLASRVGFSACFSSPTPTPWVFPPAFLLTHPSQYIRQKKLCIFCDKIMYPIYETTHICYIKHNSFIEFKRIVFHTENLFYNPDFHPSTQTTFYRVV